MCEESELSLGPEQKTRPLWRRLTLPNSPKKNSPHFFTPYMGGDRAAPLHLLVPLPLSTPPSFASPGYPVRAGPIGGEVAHELGIRVDGARLLMLPCELVLGGPPAHGGGKRPLGTPSPLTRYVVGQRAGDGLARSLFSLLIPILFACNPSAKYLHR